MAASEADCWSTYNTIVGALENKPQGMTLTYAGQTMLSCYLAAGEPMPESFAQYMTDAAKWLLLLSVSFEQRRLT